LQSQKDETVFIGGPEKTEIRIVDYNPEWPAQYQHHASIITAALGDALLRIEHIGSTSVPGLAAKAVIDILVVVPDSADEPSYLSKLELAGYELRVREPDFYEHRMLRTSARDVHIHIYSPGVPEIERNIAFRDWLRTHPEDRKLYEDTKRSLAKQSWSHMDAYAQAKTEVIESIIASALAGLINSNSSPC